MCVPLILACCFGGTTTDRKLERVDAQLLVGSSLILNLETKVLFTYLCARRKEGSAEKIELCAFVNSYSLAVITTQLAIERIIDNTTFDITSVFFYVSIIIQPVS